MENMELWDKLKSPPEEAKKKITGGRLKGMTDIKPQWRFKIITETFGPVGIGWKYTIEKLWTEKTDDAHICAFALVNFFYRQGEWSEAIPGIGGSMLITQEKGGTHTSDEAYKMAVTDALSVAMKSLGVGADVYMGYSDSKNPTQAQPPQSSPQPASGATISEAQGKRLFAICKESGTTIADCANKFGFKKAGEIQKSQYKEICEWAKAGHDNDTDNSAMGSDNMDEPF